MSKDKNENQKKEERKWEEEIKEKIKKHGDTLDQLNAQGKKLAEQVRSLQNQQAQTISNSQQIVGAIAGLQELLDKDEGKSKKD